MLLTYSRKYRTKLWLTITLWWTPKSRQKSTEFKLCIELSFHLNNIVRMVFLLSRSVLVSRRCDRHGRELAGVSPAIALERREYVGKGKGARRNFPDLPEEG